MRILLVDLVFKDGFKLVFECNKVVLCKYGTFVRKGYVFAGLFRVPFEDFCNKVVNNVWTSADGTNVWHPRLCHIIFCCMM